MPKLNFNHFSLLAAFLVVIWYLGSFFSESGNLTVYVHDSLDSHVVMFKILAESGLFFSSSHQEIPNIINGLPRAYFPSEFNVVSILFYFFNPEVAYLFNEFLIRIIAFIGMYLLLSRHFSTCKTEKYSPVSDIVLVGVSLAFSLLPFYSIYGAGVAGQPLVLFAFLNIKHNKSKLTDWGVICLYPFYGSLFFTSAFFIFVLAVMFFYDAIKTKKINWLLLLSILLMSVIFLIVEYRMVLNYFSPLFVSHRTEYLSIFNDLKSSKIKVMKVFYYGQYHAHSLHSYFILPLVVFSSALMLFTDKYAKYILRVTLLALSGYIMVFAGNDFHANWSALLSNNIYDHRVGELIYCFFIISSFVFIFKGQLVAGLLLMSLLLISFFSGFEDYEGIRWIKEAVPFFTQFQIDRFYTLFAILWFILFFFALRIVINKDYVGGLLVSIVLFLQVSYSFSFQNGEVWRSPSEWNKFYSTRLFDNIKDHIKTPVEKYRVISIGLHPSIALYNGMYTLDAYLVHYPLKYKHQFRKIISSEIEKNKKWRSYFDDWGNRCRLVNHGEEISLDLEQFKVMGGKYILSKYVVNINNGKGISFIKKFTDKESYFDVYLYQVK